MSPQTPHLWKWNEERENTKPAERERTSEFMSKSERYESEIRERECEV